MKKTFTKQNLMQRDIELLIGKLLRYGVILSCFVTLFGGLIYLFQQHGVKPNYNPVASNESFVGTAEYLREFGTIISNVLLFDGAAIIQLGVIILIATPVLRVAFSAVAFLLEKDYMYVVITLIVLGIILTNMILGIH